MKIGILGGTFDPPHVGHLVLADQALHQLGLDVVWFMPVGQPPHKPNNHVTPAQHRVAMIELAIADHPRFQLTRVDVDRPPPHYTASALELLHRRYPEHEWVFILGADALADLPRWYHPEQIVALAELAAAERPDARLDLAALERALPGLTRRLHWIRTPLMDVASSTLQQIARNGGSLRYLVTPEVQAYIRTHRLYCEQPCD